VESWQIFTLAITGVVLVGMSLLTVASAWADKLKAQADQIRKGRL
jgi:hypothetical protein